jgi:hypothetical protein
MKAQSKETRLQQQALLNSKLQARLAMLAEKGMDEKAIARDVTVKELKSKLKETAARLRAIEAAEKLSDKLGAVKAEKLANPQKNMPRVKKAAEPEPEAKPKKKKKTE